MEDLKRFLSVVRGVATVVQAGPPTPFDELLAAVRPLSRDEAAELVRGVMQSPGWRNFVRSAHALDELLQSLQGIGGQR